MEGVLLLFVDCEGIVAFVITCPSRSARQRSHMQSGSSINGRHVTNLFPNNGLSRCNAHRHILISIFRQVYCFTMFQMAGVHLYLFSEYQRSERENKPLGFQSE